MPISHLFPNPSATLTRFSHLNQPMFSPEEITNLHDLIRPAVLYLLETNTLSLTYPKHQHHSSVFILIMENFYTPIPSATKHGLSSELKSYQLMDHWAPLQLFRLHQPLSTIIRHSTCHHMQACDSHAYTLSGSAKSGCTWHAKLATTCYQKSKKEG